VQTLFTIKGKCITVYICIKYNSKSWTLWIFDPNFNYFLFYCLWN